jgi:predicted MarR family transcription regulator
VSDMGALGLSEQDERWLAAQDKHTQAFGRLVETAHIAAIGARAIRNLESAKERAEEAGRNEAAACFAFAIDAVKDGRDLL